MPRTTDGFTTRRLLAAGIAAAALLAVSPAAAIATPAQTVPTSAVTLADPTGWEQKAAVAVKFDLGDDANLIGKEDRDFVIALWKHLKDKPAHLEVRAAAEQAFTTGDQACSQFIVTDVFAAYDRDVERERREAEAKRLSDAARAAAASAVDIVAKSEMLNGTDARFAELIWLSVKDLRDTDGDAMWPKVKAAADDARASEAKQREFIATGLAAAAKQDTDDRIAKDKARTEAQKAAARARAAKQFAANRIGMPVTEELLNLPYRDFVITVGNFAADGTWVHIAAFEAYRSTKEVDWVAFVDTGIHLAKDQDNKVIDDKEAAETRRLVEELLARAEKAGQVNLPQAARRALAGTPGEIAAFLHTGQYTVKPDLPDPLDGTVRFGRVTGLADKCLDIPNSVTTDGTRVQLYDCNNSAAQNVTSPGDGTMRLLGKCVDAGGPPVGSPGDRYVHLWTCNGTGAQQWKQRPDGRIYQPDNDRCLDAPGSNNGAQLYLHTCHGGDNQKWTIAAPDGARFGQVTGVGGRCFDVPNGANADRTPVTLFDCNKGFGQDVTLPSDNTLRLVGKCLDSTGPLIGGPGQRLVYLWTCNGSPAQKWHQNTSDGTLYNEGSKYCLDTLSGNNGAQLYVHPCNAGTNQRWKLPSAK
jgi:hypothetical protein